MNEKFLIPLSILVSGLLVALGIWWSVPSENNDNAVNVKIPEIKKDFQIEDALTSYELDIVSKDKDVILGNPEADVFIIEYTDLECPACTKYHQHPERAKLLKKYENNKRVAFVLRHLPLKSLHPGAFQKAVATECVRQLSGSQEAFEFANTILSERTTINNLSKLALKYRITADDLEECLAKKGNQKIIEDSYQGALALGINATPSIFVQRKSDGKSFTMKEKMWDSRVVDAIVDYFLNQKNDL